MLICSLICVRQPQKRLGAMQCPSSSDRNDNNEFWLSVNTNNFLVVASMLPTIQNLTIEYTVIYC